MLWSRFFQLIITIATIQHASILPMQIVQAELQKLSMNHPNEWPAAAHSLQNYLALFQDYYDTCRIVSKDTKHLQSEIDKNPWIKVSETEFVDSFSILDIPHTPDMQVKEVIFKDTKLSLRYIPLGGSYQWDLYIDAQGDQKHAICRLIEMLNRADHPTILKCGADYESSVHMQCAYTLASFEAYIEPYRTFQHCNSEYSDSESNKRHTLSLQEYYKKNCLSQDAQRIIARIQRALLPNHEKVLSKMTQYLGVNLETISSLNYDAAFEALNLWYYIETLITHEIKQNMGILYHQLHQLLQKKSRLPGKNLKIKGLFSINTKNPSNTLPLSIFNVLDAPELVLESEARSDQFLAEFGLTKEMLKNPKKGKKKAPAKKSKTKKKKKKAKQPIVEISKQEIEEVSEAQDQAKDITQNEELEATSKTDLIEVIIEPESHDCHETTTVDQEIQTRTEGREEQGPYNYNMDNNNERKLIYNLAYVQTCNNEKWADNYHGHSYAIHKIVIDYGTKTFGNGTVIYRLPCKVKINGNTYHGNYKVVMSGTGIIFHFGPEYQGDIPYCQSSSLPCAQNSPLHHVLNQCDVRRKTIGIPVHLLETWGTVVKKSANKVTYQSVANPETTIKIYKPADA